MTGLAYYRIQRDLSRKELAELIGCATETVYLYEKLAQDGKGRSSLWLDFSDCLEVPVQELLKIGFPDVVDRNNGRTVRWSKTANPNNPITNYYRTHRLSYKELAERLGYTSRECGRKACTAKVPLRKHIRALASYEGISEHEFIKKYSNEKEGK